MESAIRFFLSDPTLSLLIIGLVFSVVSLARRRGPLPAPVVVEALLYWFVFFSVGISFFYNFVLHVFFADMAAHFIGWSNSPFQYEVGFASLGFAAVGFFSFRRGLEARVAAILGPAGFLWGAAGGHIHQMIVAHNFAPGNAGVILWTDILLPIIGFVLLYLQHRLRSVEWPVVGAAD